MGWGLGGCSQVGKRTVDVSLQETFRVRLKETDFSIYQQSHRKKNNKTNTCINAVTAYRNIYTTCMFQKNLPSVSCDKELDGLTVSLTSIASKLIPQM